MMVDFAPEKTWELPSVPSPATTTFSTAEHISLYSAATGPGSSASKTALSHTRSTEACAFMLFRTLDRLKVDGMKTLRWFEALAKKVAKPSGDCRSRLTKTGLAVWPPVTSTLKRCGSVMSPEVAEKCLPQSSVLYSATYPDVTCDTLEPPL